jgi:hypothetical protein
VVEAPASTVDPKTQNGSYFLFIWKTQLSLSCPNHGFLPRI